MKTATLLLAGGADPQQLPSDLELVQGNPDEILGAKLTYIYPMKYVENGQDQALPFIFDGRMGAHIKDENNQFLIVAEVEDLSLALFGGAFTARAILAWFVIARIIGLLVASGAVTSNIRNLTQAAEKFGAGDYVTPITAEGEDEVARLAKVFEQARCSIGGFIEEVLGAFPGLLLPVSRDGVIGEHISTRSQELLDKPAGKPISDALFNGNGDFSSMLELAVADGSDISFEDLMSLAPQQVVVADRTWQLTYALTMPPTTP